MHVVAGNVSLKVGLTWWYSAHKACGELLLATEDSYFCPECLARPPAEDTVLVPVCPHCKRGLPESARKDDGYECPACQKKSVWPPR